MRAWMCSVPLCIRDVRSSVGRPKSRRRSTLSPPGSYGYRILVRDQCFDVYHRCHASGRSMNECTKKNKITPEIRQDLAGLPFLSDWLSVAPCGDPSGARRALVLSPFSFMSAQSVQLVLLWAHFKADFPWCSTLQGHSPCTWSDC